MKAKAGLMVFCLGGLLSIATFVQAKVVYVPDNYSTIQEAIEAVSSGDTIVVREGIYTENVEVNKNLVIQSEKGADSTIIEAADSDNHVFEIKAAQVEINGFTTKGALGDKRAGIYLKSGADYGRIINNICRDNYGGIGLASNYNQIENNNCQSNSKAGIGLASSFGNKITRNTCSKNEYGIGISESTCALTEVINQAGVTNSRGILDLTRQFRDKNLKREYVDLYYQYSPDLKRILMEEPDLAIEAFSLITRYQPAIKHLLDQEDEKEMEMAQKEIGEIVLFIKRLENKISEEKLTIGMERSNEMVRLLEGFKEEISLSRGKNFSQMFQNSPYFAPAETKLLRARDNQAQFNFIYLNSFIDNTHNAYSDYPDTLNAWNSPEKIAYLYKETLYENYLGNYWDDYSGLDEDGDGIGDSSYSVNSEKDNYPLMESFENYEIRTSLTPPSAIVITSPLEITPEDTYYVGDKLTAKFTLTNRETGPFAFSVVVVGGRNPDGEVIDFDKEYNVTLNPTESYDYQGILTLPDKPGPYHFFCAYQTANKNWNTNINVEIEGKIIEDSEAERYREIDIIVLEKTSIFPSPLPILWKKIEGPWNEKQSGIGHITVHPNNPETIYAVVKHYHHYWGYKGDKLYKSVNGGDSWTQINQGLPSLTLSEYYWPISEIAIASSNPDVIYIATSDLNPYSSPVPSAKGIYKSTNGGLEWISVGGPSTGKWIFKSHCSVSSMAIDSINPDIVYVGTVGGGIWKTINGGKFWKQIWDEPVNKETFLEIAALAISPVNSNIIYAAAYNFNSLNAKGWSGILIPNRLIKSEDGGDTWQRLNWGILMAVPKIDDIAVDSKDADRVYAMTEHYKVYSSMNGGKNWNEASGTDGNNPLPYIFRPWSLGKSGSVSIHPDYSNIIYASGEWGLKYVYFSPDSGENWFPLGDWGNKNVKEIVLSRGKESNALYAVAIEGLFKVNIPSSVILVQLHSSSELRVYDSQERTTGLVTGEVKEEIPNSTYNDETKTVIILPPTDSYHYEVGGTEEETYSLDIIHLKEEEVATFTATDISTSERTIHQYTIDWDKLSRGEKGATIQIDADGDGIFEKTINTGSTLTSAVEEESEELKIPQSFSLSQNYPNPFNPRTVIRYQLPTSSRVSLKIYNLTGRLVKSLVEQRQEAGYYTVSWDGRDNLGREVNSGIYFYQIIAGQFNQTKKMVLIK